MSSGTTTERRRLRRSTTERVIGGVCGGIADFFEIDPVVVRIVAVALTLLDGVGVFLYIAAWLIMPEGDPDEERAEPLHAGETASVLIGTALIAVGGLLLVDRLVPGMLRTFGRITWPLALIGIGVAILFHRR